MEKAKSTREIGDMLLKNMENKNKKITVIPITPKGMAKWGSVFIAFAILFFIFAQSSPIEASPSVGVYIITTGQENYGILFKDFVYTNVTYNKSGAGQPPLFNMSVFFPKGIGDAKVLKAWKLDNVSYTEDIEVEQLQAYTVKSNSSGADCIFPLIPTKDNSTTCSGNQTTIVKNGTVAKQREEWVPMTLINNAGKFGKQIPNQFDGRGTIIDRVGYKKTNQYRFEIFVPEKTSGEFWYEIENSIGEVAYKHPFWDASFPNTYTIVLTNNNGTHSNEWIILNVSNISCGRSDCGDIRITFDNSSGADGNATIPYTRVQNYTFVTVLNISTGTNTSYTIHAGNPSASDGSSGLVDTNSHLFENKSTDTGSSGRYFANNVLQFNGTTINQTGSGNYVAFYNDTNAGNGDTVIVNNSFSQAGSGDLYFSWRLSSITIDCNGGGSYCHIAVLGRQDGFSGFEIGVGWTTGDQFTFCRGADLGAIRANHTYTMNARYDRNAGNFKANISSGLDFFSTTGCGDNSTPQMLETVSAAGSNLNVNFDDIIMSSSVGMHYSTPTTVSIGANNTENVVTTNTIPKINFTANFTASDIAYSSTVNPSVTINVVDNEQASTYTEIITNFTTANISYGLAQNNTATTRDLSNATMTEGIYFIYARAYDNTSNNVTQGNKTLIVDTTKPVLRLVENNVSANHFIVFLNQSLNISLLINDSHLNFTQLGAQASKLNLSFGNATLNTTWDIHVPAANITNRTLVGNGNYSFELTFKPNVSMATNEYNLTLQAIMYDNATNTQTAYWSGWVMFDNQSPTVTNTTPANSTSDIATTANISATFHELINGNTINNTTVLLSKTGTSANISGVLVYQNATNKGQLIFNPDVTLQGGTNYTFNISVNVSAGGTCRGCQVRDMVGNPMNSVYTFTFVTTGTLPKVNITTTNNTTTTNSTPTIHVNIVDNEAVTTYVEIFANGTNKSYTLVQNNTITALNWTSTTDGIYSYFARAYDNDSNNVSTGNMTLIVDKTAPIISTSTGAGNDTNKTVANRTPNWAFQNFTITDNIYLENMSFELTGVNGTTINYSLTKQENQFYYTTNLTNLVAGNYSYIVYANDSAGNTGKFPTNWFLIEEKSTIYWMSPTNGSSFTNTQPINFAFNHTNALVHTFGCTLLNDNTNLSFNGSCTNNTVTNFSQILTPIGTYRISVNVTTNNTNNRSEILEITITQAPPEQIGGQTSSGTVFALVAKGEIEENKTVNLNITIVSPIDNYKSPKTEISAANINESLNLSYWIANKEKQAITKTFYMQITPNEINDKKITERLSFEKQKDLAAGNYYYGLQARNPSGAIVYSSYVPFTIRMRPSISFNTILIIIAFLIVVIVAIYLTAGNTKTKERPIPETNYYG